jgi:glucose/arabinose dehydrogenase
LLSVAFPPGFAGKQHFFVYYTDLAGNVVISRFQVSGNPDVADAGSESVVIGYDHPVFSNHNGGQLAFGPDGYLYIGTGDGGGGGDPFGNAQNLGVVLGKMLRIDVESGSEQPYVIPSDNPFLGVEGSRPELWASGMRNPWRFSFDAQTGDLYVADVGQDRYEEIDYQPATSPGGENYGWNTMEGAHCFQPMFDCDQTGLTLPVAEYDHSDRDCAVIGGSVYRGADYPGLQGIYFFGDLCTGRIRGLKLQDGTWQTAILLDSGPTMTTFGTDENGRLLVAGGSGTIYEVIEDR